MGRTERNGQVGSPRIAGRYRLIEKLGTGGMSEVWRGYDETLGRPVAVKVLSPRLADDQTFRDRLRQEALAAARLCHPHITGIFDFGQSPLDERLTVPYVVMELNDGESVAARITRQGALPWREAVAMAVEVSSALATAHARGVVHRDVTPANVMLTGGGAKVVDFGISAIVGQRDAAPDGSLLGTPAYLAPERLAGSPVSAAYDVYALGLLLYRALAGRLPWPAENTAEALRAHLYADPEPLPSIADMPPVVADLCLRCLIKDPADRPGAAEVARDLAAVIGLQPIIPPVTERADDAPETARGAAPTQRLVPPGRDGLGRAMLAWLGLPGGTPGPRPGVRVLRLRAGLKVGAALRLGGARPLGGGLFEGGRVSLGFLRSRHRLQAGAVTLAVVAVAGLSWITTRDTPDVQEAQAAGTAVAGPSDDARCSVRYQLRRDSGRDYEAQLTVATTEELAQSSWRVQFSYPGTQQLSGSSKAVTQRGSRVTAKGHGALKSFTLRGSYSDYNPLPLAFAVDGVKCRAEVIAGAGVPASRRDDRTRAPQQRPQDGTGTEEISEAAAEKGTPRRNGPSHKNGTPRKKVGDTEPTRRPPAAETANPPTARKGTGLSLAM